MVILAFFFSINLFISWNLFDLLVFMLIFDLLVVIDISCLKTEFTSVVLTNVGLPLKESFGRASDNILWFSTESG